MPDKLLLTGATGFLGYYLAHALAAGGRRFTALVRPGARVSHLEELNEWCTLREGDLTDPESLQGAVTGVDTVIHAAAMISFEDRLEDDLLLVNGEGTADLVNAMLHAGARRLVHVGSVSALDRRDGGPAVRVVDRWPAQRPTTAYARSKFAAEREVWRGQAEGLSVAAVYPTTMVGAGDWRGRNTPSLWRYVNGGGRFYPRGTAGFVDVRDVARAVLTLLERDLDGERFLLNADNLSWETFFDRVAASIDGTPPGIGLSRWQSAALWPLAGAWARLTGNEPAVTRGKHRTAQASYRYDGNDYVAVTGNDYIPLASTFTETGKAFRMSQTLGQGMPPTYLPLLSSHHLR